MGIKEENIVFAVVIVLALLGSLSLTFGSMPLEAWVGYITSIGFFTILYGLARNL